MLMLMSKSESANVHPAETMPQAHSIVRYHCRAPPSSIKFGTDLSSQGSRGQSIIYSKEADMKRQITLFSATLLVLLSLSAIAAESSLTARSASSPTRSDKSLPAQQLAFRNAMRKLWEDHITWTRVFIISAAGDLPDKGPATERLLQNQVDIGNAIKPYYGDEAGEKLTALLKEHITTAAEIVTAAKAGDTTKMTDANRRWFANADAIAAFLSGANPKNWPSGEMKAMMHEHLNQTTAEVQARLKGDWAADIAAYDRVHEQILRMADMLSDGIINQFPKKFK
jgi:hypothetical protein